ncbi:dehydrase and lipid transport-domain-containing protein [Gymnopilus junonius]|uniref:Dehydrase and lipid transport-domain-containing protein n=1 Tax=Gymnopilus junonius TaxID=109634 RepID=A0A9P5TUY9_GYMJU|nr:dehydrase and lipid transport-domain-containing protein [Gymnopilus junonius]
MLLSTIQLKSLAATRGCLRRSLFSFPSFPVPPFGIGSKAQNYYEEKIFPYTDKELYAVVADVASYPQFIPFCTGSRIDKSALGRAMQEKTAVDAELTVGFLNFKESYVSTVTCIPFKSVQAQASSSTPLFKTLSTTWNFQDTIPTAWTARRALNDSTLVSFDLAYEFANPIHAGISAAFFGQVSKLMIKAFEERCLAIYGSRDAS